MGNLNPDKDNEIKNDRRNTRSRILRVSMSEGASVASAERILISAAMIVFALVLLLSVVIFTLVNKTSSIHDHNFETKLELVGEKYNIVKRCTDEKCEFSEILVEDIRDFEVLTETLPTCTEDGKRVYAFNHDGKDFTYEEVLAKTNHRVNGVNVNELKTSDGCLAYDGQYVQVLLGNDAKLECGKTYSSDVAGFTCSSCGEFINEKVKVSHTKGDKWIAVEGIEVTCSSGGLEVLYCKFCKIEIMEQRSVPALSHLYKHELVYNKTSGSVQLISTCTRNGCDEGLIKDVTKEVSSEIVDATCKSPSKTIYTYVIDGDNLQCEVLGDSTGGKHVITANKRQDGTYDYDPDCTIPLIVGNSSKIECGTTSEAFYLRCEECGTPMEQVKVNIPDHKYVFEKKNIITLPSFTDDGMVLLRCDNEWCKHERKAVVKKLTLGEGGNAVIVPGGGGDYHEMYIYKTEIEGCVVEFNVKIPKNAVPSN